MPSSQKVAVGAVLAAATAAATQFPYPYPYPSPSYPYPSPSGYCSCEDFCQNECVYARTNATNVTLYRMSPYGVFDLSNKNTGNVAGDAQFVISKRTDPNNCRQFPTSPQCQDFTQFDGDDPNSTDLIIEVQVEWDGKWGPYLECNDLNTSDPLGVWACAYEGYYPTPGVPATCSALNYSAYASRCFGEDPYEKTAPPLHKELVKDAGACCELASKNDAEYWLLKKKECSIWKKYPGGMSACSDGTIGMPDSSDPDPDECHCKRIFTTMGRETISWTTASTGESASLSSSSSSASASASASSLRTAWPSPYYPSPAPREQEAYWYSHPAGGECKDGHYVGDGSGCTWRHVKTTSVINASCMYAKFDTLVESYDPTCFVKCDDPSNKTSECYSSCYESAQYEISHRNFTNAWKKAMGKGIGACPQVKIPGLKVDRV